MLFEMRQLAFVEGDYMSKQAGLAYSQNRVIFVNCCGNCPYRYEGAIASLCNGQNISRGKVVENRVVYSLKIGEIPDWCPLESAE